MFELAKKTDSVQGKQKKIELGIERYKITSKAFAFNFRIKKQNEAMYREALKITIPKMPNDKLFQRKGKNGKNAILNPW